ncbi:DUF4064 domain-containing protein [Terribacillus saccharophilus]|uniref:DUF4064 domain-containing protein n=1 Tax=Terribacillus saccharophilus TaxID=361277 RepID=A0A268A855_9BACI|nr:DUF4064 domain-containing protein [Terribacillus saccharophilus]PAD20297.1 hypothetical protein CHH64_14520 [Terribacillus saccharophilus]PAF18263.1 hypothetical protein CHH51_08190 [Terribacillus saccharophilus]PAF20764.1 hypothetical protein CHH49_14615 [Terribacillus saccharophilus]PAF35845.1 hypothetical protein CHH58_14755 [Terribacillus saccharophilus]
MLKRTAEKVLAIIGAIVFLITAVMTTVQVATYDPEAAREQILESGVDQTVDTGMIADIAGSIGIFVIIVSVISAILGIVAAVRLKTDRKQTGIGIMLIIVALVGSIGTFLSGFIGGMVYIIAGVMVLARRPADEIRQ